LTPHLGWARLQAALRLSPDRARFGLQTGILFVANTADRGFALVSSVVIARHFGAENVGVIGAALVLGAIVSRFSDLGVPDILQREMAQSPQSAPDMLANGLWLRGITNFAMLFFLVVYGRLTTHTANVFAIILLTGLTNAFTGWTALLSAIWAGALRMRYVALGQLFYRLLYTTGVVVVAILNLDTVQLMWVIAVSAGCQLLLSLLITQRRFFPLRVAFHPSTMRAVVSQGWPLGVASILGLTYDRVDVLIASWFLAPALVGNYYSAYNLFISILLFSNAFNNVAFSILSQKAKQSVQAVSQAYWRALALIVLFGCLATIGVLVSADWVVNLLYGQKFELAAVCLRVLSLALPFVFAENLCGVTLTAVGRQKVSMVVVCLAVVVNVVLNLVFIPRWGVLAAAVTTVITEMAILSMAMVYLARLFRRAASAAERQPAEPQPVHG
jgi:O-antigen/teichoic acid export membrane protein